MIVFLCFCFCILVSVFVSWLRVSCVWVMSADNLDLDFSVLTTNVTFDFSEFDTECAELLKRQQLDCEAEALRRIKKVSQPKSVLDALPSQEADSLALHHAVVEAYENKHLLKPRERQEFKSRKQNLKQERKARKALDYLDKKSNKIALEQQKMRRAKSIKKSK